MTTARVPQGAQAEDSEREAEERGEDQGKTLTDVGGGGHPMSPLKRMKGSQAHQKKRRAVSRQNAHMPNLLAWR